jgi:integrase
MAKIRRGTEVERGGRWYGRVRFTLPNGKRKDIWMPAESQSDAARLVREKLEELRVTGETDINPDRVIFKQLAAKYKERKIFPAKIVNGRKVAGLKSVAPVLTAWKALAEGFGRQRIKGITHSDIEQYKLARLDTPVVRGKGKKRTETQRTVATVNRELELLRAMMKFAVRQNWLVRSPFEMGDPLIDKSCETRRERVLTFEEEKRLLDACEKVSKDNRKRWAHLKGLLVAALDTGCRRGELLKLRWRHVDLRARVITVVAENCKTARARKVGVTPRLHDELTLLYKVALKRGEAGDDMLVFGLTDNFANAWRRVREEAGVKGYRWHDGRHSAVTRMVATRQPSAFIQKVSGHTQISTFNRYVNPDEAAVTEIADALAAFNESQLARVEAQGAPEVSEAVN